MKASHSISEYISSQITYKVEDILPIHFITYFRFDRTKYYGQTKSTGFVIWRYSLWSGIFYPVITCSLKPEESQDDVILKTHLNSAGMLLTIIVFIIFFISFPGSQLFKMSLPEFLLRLVFALLPVACIFLGYSYQKKKFLTEISELIKNVC